MKRYTILAFMMDRPGVLNKISMLIRRKMYNVDTLTVCQTNNPGISRMTITLHADNDLTVKRIANQIEKIIEVVSAKIIDPDKSFWREVALIKTTVTNQRLKELESEFNLKILDETENRRIIQIAGTIDYINEFIKEIGNSNIVEVARSGVTSIEI